jgi:hypothetical protein
LPEPEQERIRELVFAGSNQYLKAVPSLAEQLCLVELARRQGAAIPAELAAS